MSIQAVKDTWLCLPEYWKWGIGVLGVPFVIVAAPLILVGAALALIAGVVVDALDAWSKK